MINADYHTLKFGPFAGLLSLSEAAEIWEIDDSSIRKAISSKRLREGVDCRKFGKQWVVTAQAMSACFGGTSIGFSPWRHYLEKQKSQYREPEQEHDTRKEEAQG